LPFAEALIGHRSRRSPGALRGLSAERTFSPRTNIGERGPAASSHRREEGNDVRRLFTSRRRALAVGALAAVADRPGGRVDLDVQLRGVAVASRP
jgi:hypothetical protein